MRIFTSRSFGGTGGSFGLPLEGRLTNTRSCPSAWRVAEECAPPITANRVSGGSFGFRSDAGPFGSCPDTRFYSMSGPLQARPLCLCRYLPQAVRPHGSGLPCVAPRVASHEAVPLVDEGAEVTPHCTSHSPYQGVAQLLSTPFTMARPRFSPERCGNGCDPPLPYDHDGRINDRLGRGLRRQTGERGVEGKIPLWAYKLPGTQGCHPGFDVFSPRSREGYHIIVRTDNMAVVSHINRQGGSRSRTLDRLARRLLLCSQDKFLSLREVHVPGILNLAADFLSRQKLRPGEWMLNRQTVSRIWDLFGKAGVDLFASQESSQCPLWFSLSFPTTLGIDAFAHPWPNVSLYAFPPIKLIPAVLCRVKVSGARLLLIAPFWPSQTWFSELTSLSYRSSWEIPIRRDLLSQLQGKIWHPQPELWKLWVWPIQGQGL